MGETMKKKPATEQVPLGRALYKSMIFFICWAERALTV